MMQRMPDHDLSVLELHGLHDAGLQPHLRTLGIADILEQDVEVSRYVIFLLEPCLHIGGLGQVEGGDPARFVVAHGYKSERDKLEGHPGNLEIRENADVVTSPFSGPREI